jgi:hypothetical protein
MAGRKVRIEEANGLVTIDSGDTVLAANCTTARAILPGSGLPPLEPESAALRT